MSPAIGIGVPCGLLLSFFAACNELPAPTTPWPPHEWRATGDASMQVEFDNRLSRAFVLRNAVFAIDGRTVFSHQDEPSQPGDWPPRWLTPFPGGTLSSHERLIAYSGSLPRGEHTIQVDLGYRGASAEIQGYWFVVKSSHKAAFAAGQALRITLIAYEKGGATVPFEQRPTIEWNEGSMAE